MYKDQVTLDNGMNVTREVVRHMGAAAVVPMTENGEVILVRQYRYAVGRGDAGDTGGIAGTW